MIKEAICEGSDVQSALEKAKAQLGLDDTAEYEFEIIQTEEKKRFGLFGGKPAIVKVFIKDTPNDRAEQFLRDILDKMKLESIQIEKKTEENAVEFDLSGEEVGFVIGRRGVLSAEEERRSTRFSISPAW